MGKQRIIYSNPIFFVQCHFDRLTRENDGRLPDISQLRIRVAQGLEEDPGLFNLPDIARKFCKDWDRASHKVISNQIGEVVFVPSVAITVAPRVRVRMDSLYFEDLVTWDELERKARSNYERVTDARIGYRNQRLAELTQYPELKKLGDVERVLHGYVPDLASEMPFTVPVDLGGEEMADDEE